MTNLNTLKIGDLIIRVKGPLSTHYLVYVGIYNNVQTVAENQSGVGVRFISLFEALGGNQIKRIEPFGGTEQERYLVIPRIGELIGKPYDPIVFNCEHFARWITQGKLESKQVKTASNMTILGGIAMLFSKNRVVANIGLGMTILGVIGHISQINK
jgi:hypothetical protein